MPARSRRAKQRERQIATALAQAADARPQVIPLRKSQASMAMTPMARTSSAMVDPIYQSQIPVLEPWRYPEQFGAYGRGRLWNNYGSGVSFELLRLSVRRCLLQQAVHQVCSHDILQFSKNTRTPELPGWEVRHVDTQDESVNTVSRDVTQRIRRVTDLLKRPHPVFEPSFRGLLSKVMDDYLTINRVAIELMRDHRGAITQFRAVDGATILPTFRVLQRFIGLQQEWPSRFQAYDVAARLLERETGIPILDSEYVCVMRGQLIGSFAPGELLIWEDQPVTDVRVIFPPSYAEKALEGIVSWLYAFYANRNYFSHGNPTEVILGMKGDIQDDSFVAFEEQMRENFTGIKGFWRVPIVQLPIDGALEVIRLKENHREMQFAEWMATLQALVVSGIYRVSTKRIEVQAGGSEGQSLFAHKQVEYIEASKEESFKIHSAFLEDRFTYLVQLLDPDLEFHWTGLEVEDRQEEIKVEQIEVTTYRTVNELRRKHGDVPFTGDDAQWADLPLNALIYQAKGLSGPAASAGDGAPGGDAGSQGDEQDSDWGEEAPQRTVNKALQWEEIQV
jgi:hypothetical protein